MSAKKFRLIEPSTSQAKSSNPQNCEPFDWSKCVICQTLKEEILHCPTVSKRTDLGSGYSTLADNLTKFKELDSLPPSLNIIALDDGSGILNTLLRNNGKWHKTCNLKFNSTELKRAQKRHMDCCGDTTDSSKGERKAITRRSLPCKILMKDNLCFFCGKTDEDNKLHQASTYIVSSRVRECAVKLQDTGLLAKISAGDLIAQEAKYHSKCLVSLYKRASRVSDDDESDKGINARISHGIALAELVSFIEDSKEDEDIAPVFKMSHLTKLYTDRIRSLGVEIEGRTHSTRLKHRLLAHFPDMQEYKKGRETLLAFSDDIGPALQKACEDDYDTNYLQIYKAVKIIRKDILKTKTDFNGSFDENCQQHSVSRSLLEMVSMLLYGPDISTESYSQESLSASQILLFNSYRRIRDTPKPQQHSKSRETPSHIYLGILIHCQTRKRGLVDKLFKLGLSVSYDRVLSLSAEITNALCQQYQQDGFVCPPALRQGIFTVAAVDNIDHNPSSTTAKGSFHGTGISLFQSLSSENPGIQRGELRIQNVTSAKVTEQLPDAYRLVRPVVLRSKTPEIPKIDGPCIGNGSGLEDSIKDEYRWLQYVAHMTEDDITETTAISWGAYHAKYEVSKNFQPSISTLLPLFEEEAKSVAMIRHSLDVIMSSVQALNPGQTPVVAFDQPLYAVAKQIQWNWPDTYGENKYIIMFGGLHIEMAIFKTIGDWLECSGWTSAITQSQIATSGTADSFLNASHVTRTRRAHQISACGLYILLRNAYQEYIDSSDEDESILFDDWCSKMSSERPQFGYWYLTLKLQILALVLIKSIRAGDYQLYIESLTAIIPWFFALDHIHYARWLPVHVRDMASLSSISPNTYLEFALGKFVVYKTLRKFSAIAIDHAHEQNNALVKSDGGAIGLTENPTALRRWMIAGPELSRLVKDFENDIDFCEDDDLSVHHEQQQGTQKRFLHDVTSLVETIEEMGNPFLEDSKDLLVLDTKDIASPAVVETVRRIEQIGKDNYRKFVEDRLVNRSVSLFDPVKKNGLPLFRTPQDKTLSNAKGKITSLKSDVSLFSRLYISCQTRGSDLDDFFAHENHFNPPSLSQNGVLRQGIKSDLLTKCLEPLTTSTGETPIIDAVVIDGVVVVNIAKPGHVKTFQDYATQVFIPYILRQPAGVSRIDIVWDTYIHNSLKAATRHKRGKGLRRRVQGQNDVPKNWQTFLRLDQNKIELFDFLAEKLHELSEHELKIVSTKGEQVLVNQYIVDKSHMSPCFHEEADTRIMIHVADAAREGRKRVMIRTVDTDVVVIAVSCFSEMEVEELWVAFSSGKNFRYISIHELVNAIGPERSHLLPVFHAFTGCDTVSSFAGRGKKTAWDTWMSFNIVSDAFRQMTERPNLLALETVMPLIERFVILLYDRTSEAQDVNEARKILFAQKGRSIEMIPPSYGALIEHTKRSTYQGGCIWCNSLILQPDLPDPSQFGWKKDKEGLWQPYWTALPEASVSCQELLHCGCKKGCRTNCKCRKATLSCSALCCCGGDCD